MAVELLERAGLYGVELTYASGAECCRDIRWTQVSRNLFGNAEIYRECIYTGPKGEKVKVFVADGAGNRPDSFNTSGYEGMLHLGILSSEKPILMFFVIHPTDWYPYQHRFKTDELMNFFSQGTAEATGAWAGVAAASLFCPAVGMAALAATAIGPSVLGEYLNFVG